MSASDPSQVDAEELARRIGGRSDGGADEYETVDHRVDVPRRLGGSARGGHRGLAPEEPRVAFAIDGADFLKLVTGNAAGPMLFMSGKLKIEGDLMFAASAASLFTIPKG